MMNSQNVTLSDPDLETYILQRVFAVMSDIETRSVWSEADHYNFNARVQVVELWLRVLEISRTPSASDLQLQQAIDAIRTQYTKSPTDAR